MVVVAEHQLGGLEVPRRGTDARMVDVEAAVEDPLSRFHDGGHHFDGIRIKIKIKIETET